MFFFTIPLINGHRKINDQRNGQINGQSNGHDNINGHGHGHRHGHGNGNGNGNRLSTKSYNLFGRQIIVFQHL